MEDNELETVGAGYKSECTKERRHAVLFRVDDIVHLGESWTLGTKIQGQGRRRRRIRFLARSTGSRWSFQQSYMLPLDVEQHDAASRQRGRRNEAFF